MELIKYKNNIHKDEWDQYVLNSNNGTIFHLRKFLAYHKDRKFEDCSLIFRDKDKIQTVFSGAIIDNCLLGSYITLCPMSDLSLLTDFL